MSNRRSRTSRRNAIAQRIALAAASLAISLLLAETAWRLLLASDTATGRRLRKPTLYADPLADDLFWLLRHRWYGQRGRFRPPSNPHPLLGWHAAHIGTDYSHRDEAKISGRRPVLLYGDSFAQGMAGVERFQKILNRDQDFAQGHYFLNYGVGGYGVDQTYLLFKHSIDRFTDPYVIFSLLTHDLDRSVLSVRIGQKPYFEVIDGKLDLRGVPIDSRPEDFFASRPPRVGSYLLRRLGRLPLFTALSGGERGQEKKKRINGAILDAAVGELEARHLDYTILVFHTRKPFRQGPDWRCSWLRSRLEGYGADYLWAFDLLRREAGDRPLEDLFDTRFHHPTTLANQIIARAIAGRVLADEEVPK